MLKHNQLNFVTSKTHDANLREQGFRRAFSRIVSFMAWKHREPEQQLQPVASQTD